MKTIIMVSTLKYLGTFDEKTQEEFLKSMDFPNGYLQKKTESGILYTIKN